jgi:hypothetical protein
MVLVLVLVLVLVWHEQLIFLRSASSRLCGRSSMLPLLVPMRQRA